MNQDPQVPIRLPSIARNFANTVLGFGVAVSLFLAPFLGAKRIPGFEPLIALFPPEHGRLLIPISSLLIGVVALVVQFYAEETIARRSIRRSFVVLAWIVVAGLLTLLILYGGFVNVWDDSDGTAKVVIVGWSRLPGCGCPPGNTRQCIAGLAFEDLGSCWSDGSIFGVKLSLFLSYLVSIEGFAAMAGLYVLQRKKIQEQKEKEKEKNKRTSKPRKVNRAGPPTTKAPPAEG